MKTEVKIITDSCEDKYKKEVEDMLILAIARCGYSPYISWDNEAICFTVDKEESLRDIKEQS